MPKRPQKRSQKKPDADDVGEQPVPDSEAIEKQLAQDPEAARQSLAPTPVSKRAIDSVLDRLDDVEQRLTALDERLTEYDKGGAKYPKDTREYVVKAGETMSQIAKRLLANAGLFGKIAMMNYDRYPSLRADSNKVDEGWTLRVPPE